MIEQLKDAANTTTPASYLTLPGGAGPVQRLQPYAGNVVCTKNTSPKLQVYKTPLSTAHTGNSLQQPPPATLGVGPVGNQHSGYAPAAYSRITAYAIKLQWMDGHQALDYVPQKGTKKVII